MERSWMEGAFAQPRHEAVEGVWDEASLGPTSRSQPIEYADPRSPLNPPLLAPVGPWTGWCGTRARLVWGLSTTRLAVVLPLSRLADQKTFSFPSQTFPNFFLPFRHSYGRRCCCSCPSFPPLPLWSVHLLTLVDTSALVLRCSLSQHTSFSITSIIARPSYNSDVIRPSGATIVEASTLERTNPAIPLRRLSISWRDPSHPAKSTSPTTTNSVSDRHARQHA